MDTDDTPPPPEAVVEGTIMVAADTPSFDHARAHIYVEEVSRVDAPAIRVAHKVVEDVRHVRRLTDGAAPTVISFDIAVRLLRTIAHPEYSLRVWVDTDGDGRDGPGDLYSDTRHRVLGGDDGVMVVRLHPR